METAQTSTEAEGVCQSWEEICKAYPDEWVLMFEMRQHPEYGHTIGGVVAAHSPNRKEAYAAIPRDRPTTRAVFYTGEIRRRWCRNCGRGG